MANRGRRAAVLQFVVVLVEQIGTVLTEVLDLVAVVFAPTIEEVEDVFVASRIAHAADRTRQKRAGIARHAVLAQAAESVVVAEALIGRPVAVFKRKAVIEVRRVDKRRGQARAGVRAAPDHFVHHTGVGVARAHVVTAGRHDKARYARQRQAVDELAGYRLRGGGAPGVVSLT